MRKDDRFLKISRRAADGPKSGGAEGGNAQFDFLQDTDTSGMEVYDEAEAWQKGGATVADRDTDEYENGLPAHREGLSSQKEQLAMNKPTDLQLTQARVAAKIAACLLPNGNPEAVENQAAILMKYLPPKALAATLERVWYDREGARIAAERIAAKQQRLAQDEEALDEAEKLMDEEPMEAEAMDMDEESMEVEGMHGMKGMKGMEMEEEEAEPMEAMADDDMAEIDDEDLNDLAEDMSEADADMNVEDDLGMEEDLMEEAEPEEEMMAEEAMAMRANDRLASRGKKIQAKKIKREASGKKRQAGDQARGKARGRAKSPKIGTPRQRRTAASKKSEIAQLSAVFGKHLGAPTEAEMKEIGELFSV